MKTYLRLAMPNKYCLQSKYKAGFGVIFWDKKSVTVMIPIYNTTVLYVEMDLIHNDVT